MTVQNPESDPRRLSVHNQSHARTEQTPVSREAEKVETLMRTIRDDARSLSDTYPKQTIVPEGGE